LFLAVINAVKRFIAECNADIFKRVYGCYVECNHAVVYDRCLFDWFYVVDIACCCVIREIDFILLWGCGVVL